MNNEYRYLIYSNKQDENRNIQNCMNIAAELSNCTITSIEKDIANRISSEAVCNYTDALLWSEGTALFKLICDSFAIDLWKSNDCLSAECTRKCPFGDICQKDYISIDNKKICYGKLTTSYGIKSSEELIKLAEDHNISICGENESIIADLNSSYDEQRVES